MMTVPSTTGTGFACLREPLGTILARYESQEASRAVTVSRCSNCGHELVSYHRDERLVGSRQAITRWNVCPACRHMALQEWSLIDPGDANHFAVVSDGPSCPHCHTSALIEDVQHDADGEQRRWKCLSCGREILQDQSPLTAVVAPLESALSD
jgi:DNA-directed RNA polymerase subunit RPC12/RpoP